MLKVETDPISVDDGTVMRVSDRSGETSKSKIFQVVEMSLRPRAALGQVVPVQLIPRRPVKINGKAAK